MVLCVNRDVSRELCYSSVKEDHKSWNRNRQVMCKANRFAVHSFNAAHALERPHTVDVVYKTKPGMADAMKGAKEDDTASVGGWYIACSALKLGGLGAAAASYAQRSGYRAMTPKAVDINAARLGDIRTGSTKVPYNYVRPLGPGSYMGPDEKQKVMWAKKYGKGSTYDDSRPSSSFLSRPRPPLLARPAADLSDVLRRDRAHWTAKGCFTSKQARFRKMNITNDKGDAKSLCNFGGTYDMAQSARTPAFDAVYDTDQGNNTTIARRVADKVARMEAITERARFKKVPVWVAVDAKSQHRDVACSEWIGPGTYSYGAPHIGTANIHAGTALGRYDSTFRGARRFSPINTHSEFEGKPAGPAGIYSR